MVEIFIKTFRINDFISLKLNQDGKTKIFISGEYFSICKSLIVNLPFKEVNSINSIDELIQIYSYESEHSLDNILLPQEEFWGHCSNIQTWVESRYNSSLIDSKLGFPILNKLAEIGDIKAKIAYKSAIIDKLKEKSLKAIIVIFEIINERFFTIEEEKTIFEEIIEDCFKSIAINKESEIALEIFRLIIKKKGYDIFKPFFVKMQNKKQIIDFLLKKDDLEIFSSINEFQDILNNYMYEILSQKIELDKEMLDSILKIYRVDVFGDKHLFIRLVKTIENSLKIIAKKEKLFIYNAWLSKLFKIYDFSKDLKCTTIDYFSDAVLENLKLNSNLNEYHLQYFIENIITVLNDYKDYKKKIIDYLFEYTYHYIVKSKTESNIHKIKQLISNIIEHIFFFLKCDQRHQISILLSEIAYYVLQFERSSANKLDFNKLEIFSSLYKYLEKRKRNNLFHVYNEIIVNIVHFRFKDDDPIRKRLTVLLIAMQYSNFEKYKSIYFFKKLNESDKCEFFDYLIKYNQYFNEKLYRFRDRVESIHRMWKVFDKNMRQH